MYSFHNTSLPQQLFSSEVCPDHPILNYCPLPRTVNLKHSGCSVVFFLLLLNKKTIGEAIRRGQYCFFCPRQFGSFPLVLSRYWCLVFNSFRASLTTVIKCGCALFLWEISCHSETSTVSILRSLEFQHKGEQKKRKTLLLDILWGTGWYYLREEINWAVSVDIGEMVSLRVKKQLGCIKI